jgi:hypothetical protein
MSCMKCQLPDHQYCTVKRRTVNKNTNNSDPYEIIVNVQCTVANSVYSGISSENSAKNTKRVQRPELYCKFDWHCAEGIVIVRITKNAVMRIRQGPNMFVGPNGSIRPKSEGALLYDRWIDTTSRLINFMDRAAKPLTHHYQSFFYVGTPQRRC